MFTYMYIRVCLAHTVTAQVLIHDESAEHAPNTLVQTANMRWHCVVGSLNC